MLFTPQIVPKENLTKIQGINQTINAVCLLLAPAIGGVLLGSIGLVWAFMVDVVTAVIAITIMSIIKVERQNVTVNTNSMISDIRAGIVYVLEHSELKKLIVFMPLLLFY